MKVPLMEMYRETWAQKKGVLILMIAPACLQGHWWKDYLATALIIQIKK